MALDTVLITGGYGCIGAHAAQWLNDHSDANLVMCSRNVNADRTARLLGNVDPARLQLIQADVAKRSDIDAILSQHDITRVIHLAALQTPDCNAKRDVGLQINLAGTQHLIESIKQYRPNLNRFVFASSIAVYGPRDHYRSDRVPMLAPPAPVNVYGVWKLAAEHLARLFQSETRIPTVCLRPGVLYGPGRDAGLTSTPTTALKCIALDRAYTIPFRSRQDYLFAPDVGAAFGQVTLAPFDGFGVFTLPSHTATTEEFVTAMKLAAVEHGFADQCKIDIGPQEVPFICDLEFEPFTTAFPDCPHTDLEQGIAKSLITFRQQVEQGLLTENDVH